MREKGGSKKGGEKFNVSVFLLSFRELEQSMNFMTLSAQQAVWINCPHKRMLFGDGEEIFGAMVTYWSSYLPDHCALSFQRHF